MNAKNKYNWQEIIDFVEKNPHLNKKDIAKKFNVAPETLSRGLNSYYTKLNEDIFLKKFAKQQLGIKKEQKVLMYQRQMINKNLRDQGLITNVVKKLKHTKHKYSDKDFLLKDEHTFNKKIFLIGDLHYKDEETSEYLKKIPMFLTNNCKETEDIIIVFGGDFIENNLHNSQLLERTDTAMEQTINVSNLLSSALKFFLKTHTGKLDIYGLIGNHDEIRQLSFKANEDRRENVTPIISGILKNELKEFSNVTVYPFTYDLHFKKDSVYIRHGHFIRNINYLESRILKEREQQPKLKDVKVYVFFHFHKFKIEMIKGTDIILILAPAMKKWNSYFEYSNNLVNTYGILMIQGSNYLFIR